MGQEIASSHFSTQDFQEFKQQIQLETTDLAQWLAQNRFASAGPVGGFEVEAWLVDAKGDPAPVNQEFLANIHHELVVPELARFNVELNTQPQALQGRALHRMHQELDETWQHCQRVADSLGVEIIATGILPTVTQAQLTLANMSPLQRFYALNEQIQRTRGTRPIHLTIDGKEPLDTLHQGLMVESAATSFQVHLQVTAAQSVRFYNASHILSAPLVAVAANSPYLFGHDLWAETRIPLFEQAVAGCVPTEDTTLARVTFGQGYAEDSLLECFEENLAYPPLLPVCTPGTRERLGHMRLHNGTIWRWNRPLIGFNEAGTPHLRIEHRVIPAGPTTLDAIANAALFYGLVQVLATQEEPPEKLLPFAQARTNFYQAARYGLDASVVWLDGKAVGIQHLLLDILLPMAHQGLQSLDLDPADIEFYLGIIEARLMNQQNGTSWQRAFVHKHRATMHELTYAYIAHQKSGVPVHAWEV